MTQIRNSNSGFSLVEILISVGVMMIVALAMITITVSQQRQTKAIEQKLESLDFKQSMSRYMIDKNICKCVFSGVNWNPVGNVVSISELKGGCGSAPAIATVGKKLSTTSDLQVQSIKLKNIQDVDLSDVNFPKRSGVLEVEFTGNIGPLKSVTMSSAVFQINAATNTIFECVGIAGALEMCVGMGGSWINNTCMMPGPSASEVCQKLGGTWSQGICRQPAGTTTADCVAAYGTGWAYLNGACVPPTLSKPIPSIAGSTGVWQPDPTNLNPYFGAANHAVCAGGGPAVLLQQGPSGISCAPISNDACTQLYKTAVNQNGQIGDKQDIKCVEAPSAPPPSDGGGGGV